MGLILISPHLYSQAGTSKAPVWLLYEMGKAELERVGNPEPGRALALFRQAIDQTGGKFPEAEEAIGDIYVIESEYVLAVEQYKKAYDMRYSFTIPGEKYLVLQKLAQLYKRLEAYSSMEEEFKLVLADQPYYSEANYEKYRNAFRDLYREKGLEQLLKLYRLEKIDFALKSHADLGWYYYRTGRSYHSILNTLFALDIMVTEAMIELRLHDPEYEFTTLASFVNACLKRANIRDYLMQNEFFKVLYYLAAADYSDRSILDRNNQEIWAFLSSTVEAGRYGDLSRKQLESPWVEPLINPSMRKLP